MKYAIKTSILPKNIVVTESDHVSQGLTVASLDVSWDKVEGAIRYVAQWRKDNGDWINVPVTSAQGFSVQGIYSGSYDVRVRALNAQDTSSPWGYAETTYLSGKTPPCNTRSSAPLPVRTHRVPTREFFCLPSSYHLIFKVDKPIKTRIMVMIQKRTTT